MNHIPSLFKITVIPLLLVVVSACSSTKELGNSEFAKSSTEAETIVSKLSGYNSMLSTLQGKGKAIVSEPGNTDRVTVYFFSTRDKSLIKVKNSLGIEGGELLTDGDSLLIYNKIDKVARRVPIREGNLNRINNLASLNILSLINFTVTADQVQSVLESNDQYQLILNDDVRLTVNKETYTIQRIQQPKSSDLPYSQVIYDAYDQIEEFRLPRRITIFSADASSRVNFMIQSLKVNPELKELSINLPDNITIYS